MQTDESNSEGGRGMKEQEFIWKDEFTNDVYNLQKYMSRHKKEGWAKKKKKIPHAFTVNTWEEKITTTPRVQATLFYSAAKYLVHTDSPPRNDVLPACIRFSSSAGMHSGGDTETECREESHSQHSFFPERHPKSQNAAGCCC